MKKQDEKEQVLKLLRMSEKYFYRYLITHDKAYIDRFFHKTKQLKKLIERLWETK